MSSKSEMKRIMEQIDKKRRYRNKLSMHVFFDVPFHGKLAILCVYI